ncbi:DUF4124 domain-containing protein [Dyella jiangningensis]|uniref:DUF4124 domain-containing protein n=1 Tax=Dyella jiangningensis TaxID=1379159 RepID=UPI00240FBB20|nr:DUF4124 domain-containing protein [Dyella jiangningensis]MDG2538501.1 DUF4124 domain-containing protein [Dyella jiangningensis]
MKYLALVCLLLATPVWGDIYKCVKNGQVAYQEMPCDGASQQAHVTTSSANEFVGCFAMDTGSPWTNGEQHNLAEIRAVNGGYALMIDGEPSRDPLMLKRATPGALSAVGEAFHLQATDGVTMVWRPGTPNTKPIGIYKVKDRTGHEGYFVFLFVANGLAHKQACPATHS